MSLRHSVLPHFCATASILALASLVACSPEEVHDEVTNHIGCDQICEWAVDCGRFDGSIDACDDDCEAKADQSEFYERQVEDCSECISHDDLSCQQNDELCNDVCEGVSPVTGG